MCLACRSTSPALPFCSPGIFVVSRPRVGASLYSLPPDDAGVFLFLFFSRREVLWEPSLAQVTTPPSVAQISQTRVAGCQVPLPLSQGAWLEGCCVLRKATYSQCVQASKKCRSEILVEKKWRSPELWLEQSRRSIYLRKIASCCSHATGLVTLLPVPRLCCLPHPHHCYPSCDNLCTLPQTLPLTSLSAVRWPSLLRDPVDVPHSPLI